MIVHYEKAEQRKLRLKFYKDPVFLIVCEYLTPLLGSLNIIELFASADAFAYYLVKNEITDKTFIESEIEELEEELEEDQASSDDNYENDVKEKDQFLLLTITLLKLCAMRKTHPIAATIAETFIAFCKKYKGLTELLIALNSRELKLRQEDKLPSLLEYELLSILKEDPPLQEAKLVISTLVDCCEILDGAAIRNILLPLMETNEHYGMAFTEQVDRLKKLCSMKSQSMWHADGDMVMSKYVNHEVTSVAAGGTGIQILPINSSK